MAMMCRMNGKCASGKGMCIHEKMMLIAVIVFGAGMSKGVLFLLL